MHGSLLIYRDIDGMPLSSCGLSHEAVIIYRYGPSFVLCRCFRCKSRKLKTQVKFARKQQTNPGKDGIMSPDNIMRQCVVTSKRVSAENQTGYTGAGKGRSDNMIWAKEETMSRAEIEAVQLSRLKDTVNRV